MPFDKELTVARYYDKTRLEYRLIWGTSRTMGLHFGYYDDVVVKHDEAVPNMNRVMADMAQISAGDHVLDAGCGIGGSSIWLAQHREAKATGITLSTGQLRDALQAAKRLGLTDKVNFAIADYCQTSFADASFDVVWALESQCHAPDKQAFYKEAFRVLKPGGRLVVGDYARNSRPLTPEGEQRIADWLTNLCIGDLITLDEHARFAQNVGLQVTEQRVIDKHVERSLRNAYEHCLFWNGIAKFLNRFNIISDTSYGNLFGTKRQFDAWEAGDWSYVLMLFRK